MKKYLTIIVILLSIGCNESKKQDSINDIVKIRKLSEDYIKYNGEKITLLSISKGIPCDTLQSILVDYYTERGMLESGTIKNYENIILKISDKYNLPKRIIASFIYNFEYEMLTREEILDIESERVIEEEQSNEVY